MSSVAMTLVTFIPDENDLIIEGFSICTIRLKTEFSEFGSILTIVYRDFTAFNRSGAFKQGLFAPVLEVVGIQRFHQC
jgi:hypothetical protein